MQCVSYQSTGGHNYSSGFQGLSYEDAVVGHLLLLSPRTGRGACPSGGIFSLLWWVMGWPQLHFELLYGAGITCQGGLMLAATFAYVAVPHVVF